MLKHLGDEHGTQVVEFAILLPVLLLLVFGIVDFGRGFFSWVIITNGAREGARAAAVGKDMPTVATKVQGAVAGLYVTNVESTNIGVGGCTSPANGALCIAGQNVGGPTDEPVTVAVRYNFKYIVLPNVMSWAGGPSLPSGVVPLIAQSTMRLE